MNQQQYRTEKGKQAQEGAADHVFNLAQYFRYAEETAHSDQFNQAQHFDQSHQPSSLQNTMMAEFQQITHTHSVLDAIVNSTTHVAVGYDRNTRGGKLVASSPTTYN